jgi:DsbC/DsbD-like thiol-disulfide interchange protein
MKSGCKLPPAPWSMRAPIAYSMLRLIAPLPLAVLIWLPGVTTAPAQDASNWDTQAHTASRLIAGAASKSHENKNHESKNLESNTPDGKIRDEAFLRAGIEIRLEPGWQTYWRDPGDSGAPPKFDFSASENVKSVSVLWPAPQRFPDGAGGNSIGYVNHVILPLHVVPTDDAKQTALRLKLAYDICSNICIPVEANLALALSSDGAEDPAIERAEIRVPRHVGLGTAPVPQHRAEASQLGQASAQDSQGLAGEGAKSDRLAILAAHRQPGGAHDRVLVEVAAPKGAPVDLFVEGPTPDWSLPLPQQTSADGGIRQFVFDLDGLPPGAKPDGAALTFTAVSGEEAIEVTAHLD